MREFAEHNIACIRYADWLRSTCAHAFPLPEYEGVQQRDFRKASNMALVVFYRQIGIWMFQPNRRANGDLEVLEYGGAMLIKSSPEEVQRYITLLDELKDQRSRVERLVAQAGPIRAHAVQMKAKIEDNLHRPRLPRPWCEYIA